MTVARVLQLLATGGNGGAPESYTGLLLRLDRTRYDVRALSLSAGSAVGRLRRLGVDVDVLDETDVKLAIRELAAWQRRNEIDLVHAHMFRAEVVGTRAALAAATPVIMATVHSSRVRSGVDQAELARLTPHMDRLIVPSASIEHKVRGEGREGAQFSVIPNGVDLLALVEPHADVHAARRAAHPRAAFVMGVVARLEAEKGHRFLVEAMQAIVAAVPDAWLLVVGEGTEREALAAQVAALPPPVRARVVLTGRREDVAALTADLSVAVLPSLREAQGISILEAMARGVPVVASAVGGIPEVITDRVDGLLVAPASPAALADALIRAGAIAGAARHARCRRPAHGGGALQHRRHRATCGIDVRGGARACRCASRRRRGRSSRPLAAGVAVTRWTVARSRFRRCSADGPAPQSGPAPPRGGTGRRRDRPRRRGPETLS